MSQDGTAMTSLENVVQATEDPTLTKKRRMDVAAALKTLIPEVIFLIFSCCVIYLSL